MRAHFTVCISSEEGGFSGEVSERFDGARRRCSLTNRESATSTPEEVADVVREVIAGMLHPVTEK